MYTGYINYSRIWAFLAIILTLSACGSSAKELPRRDVATPELAEPVATRQPAVAAGDAQANVNGTQAEQQGTTGDSNYTLIDTFDKATKVLLERIVSDQLYDNPKCLILLRAYSDNYTYFIEVREQHGGNCPGDPDTSPILDRFQVSRDGTISWQDDSIGSLVPYDKDKIKRR